MSSAIGSSKIASSGTPSILSSGSSFVLSSGSGSLPSGGSNPSSGSSPSGNSGGSVPSGGSGGSANSNPSGSVPSSGASSGSGGSNVVSSGGDGISYVIVAVVSVVYSEGWSVVYMMAGQKEGAAFVQNDGETAGGLTCEWSEFPAPNSLAASISGAYDTEETFNFTYYPSETETLSIVRNVQVQNTGDVDIVVNGSTVAPGDTIVGLDTSDTNPWDYVYLTVVVEKA